MSDQDIRWHQRFENFKRAHVQLNSVLSLMHERPLSDLEKQGTIQTFEFTYELAWNLLRDYLLWQGETAIAGSRDAIRNAFQIGLIIDGHGWMAMLQDRNRTVHTYNEATANDILANLQKRYALLLDDLEETFLQLESQHWDLIQGKS